MGTIINISSPQVQLRQNRTLLLITGGVATVTGLFLWSATPFLASNPKDKPSVFLRYISLVTSLGCGITAVITGHQLQRITPLLKAIDTAERNDFLDQLAGSQYVQQQKMQDAVTRALQPPVAAVNEMSYNDRNEGTVRDNEVIEKPVADTVTAVTPSETDSVMASYKPMYHSVMALKQQGITDSDIIKDVLKQGGTNYQQGKQMLEALLTLGKSQGW